MITEGRACLARDNRVESKPLSFVRSLLDNDLTLGVSLRDFAWKHAKERPIQPRERRVIEMTLNDGADVGK